MCARIEKLTGHDPEAAAFLLDATACSSNYETCAAISNKIISLPSWLHDAQNNPPDIVVMLGADAAIQKLDACLPEKCRILLLEIDPARALALFKEWPMEDLVSNGRLSLALGAKRERAIQQFAKLFQLNSSPTVQMAFASELLPEAEEFYLSIMREIREGIHLNVFNINTMILRGTQWQFNTLQNLPWLLANPGIKDLEGMFEGRPGLVVGAGPSLNDALPHIRKAADGYVIIATGTSLRPLLAAGIKPDLVVSVDASVKTAPQFEASCDDLFLVCSSFAHPPILRQFRGIFGAQLPANPIDRWMNKLGVERGFLVAAGTVTTTAIDLAKRMGCNPVVSVGFDLSFKEDGTTHANQTIYDGRRLNPEKLVRVQGNYQAEVPTTEQFRCYLALIDDYLARNTGPSYMNATNGGARIKGMNLIRPDELPALAHKSFDAYSAIAAKHFAFPNMDAKRVLPELQKAGRQLLHISENAHLGAMICNQLILMLRSPCEGDDILANEHLDALRDIDKKFHDAAESNAILEMSLWPVSYRTSATPPPRGDARADAIASNRNSRELYEQIAGASKWTRRLVDGACDNILSNIANTASTQEQTLFSANVAQQELIHA